MTVSRTVAAIALAASLTAACTSRGDGGNSAAPTGTPSGSGGTESCTKATAETAQQTLITSAGFAPSCVKIKVKAKFFFVNNEKKHHTATTKPGSPESFDADLQKKGSTYTQVFKKTGTYAIYKKISKKSMPLSAGCPRRPGRGRPPRPRSRHPLGPALDVPAVERDLRRG